MCMGENIELTLAAYNKFISYLLREFLGIKAFEK